MVFNAIELSTYSDKNLCAKYLGRLTMINMGSSTCIIQGQKRNAVYQDLSYDVASGSETTPSIKIVKPQVVYRFSGNAMTSITPLRT